MFLKNLVPKNLVLIPKNLVPKNLVLKNLVPNNLIPNNLVLLNLVPKNLVQKNLVLLSSNSYKIRGNCLVELSLLQAHILTTSLRGSYALTAWGWLPHSHGIGCIGCIPKRSMTQWLKQRFQFGRGEEQPGGTAGGCMVDQGD